MAEWKKVVVSGSSISQLSNDVNYLIDGQSGASLSGSFSGSFFGDGTGLTGVVATAGYALTDGNGIANFSYDGGTNGVTVAIELSGSAPGLVVDANGLAVGIAGITGKHIAADAVALGTQTTGNYVATLANATNGGTTITNGSSEGGAATVALNLNDLADAAVDVTADSIAIVDASATSGSKKESIVDFVAAIAGTNLTAASGQLSLSTSITGAHTFDNNVTIQGNLTVEGTQINAQVSNLDIEDRYILLNSGSGTVGDSGIVFGGSTGEAQIGSALVWDASYNSNDGRLGIVSAMSGSDTGDQTIAYHIAGVYEGSAANAAAAEADHVGNIRVESSEIYIYV